MSWYQWWGHNLQEAHCRNQNCSRSRNSDSETEVEVIFDQTVYNHSKDCRILIDSDEIRCENCAETQVIVSKCTKQKQTRLTTPASPKAPVSKTTPDRIKLTLEQPRLECTQLQARIEEMKSGIERSSKVVDNELSNDLISIMEKKSENENIFYEVVLGTTEAGIYKVPNWCTLASNDDSICIIND